MSNIYNCPNCGKKAFNPWTKAMAGQLNSPGKVCLECGRKAVNGKAATVFNAVYSVVVFALIVAIYLGSPKLAGTPNEWIWLNEVPIAFGLLISKFIVPRIANAFFFRMTPSIRIDAVK